MSAFAFQFVSVKGIRNARIGMAVANASSSNADILHAVEVPSSNSWVLPLHCHQMPKKGFCAQKTKPDVSGFAPFLQYGRMREIFRSWSVINHRDDDFSAFQRHDVRIFRGTDDTVIARDIFKCVYAKEGVTIAVTISEVLPWLEGFSVI